MIKYVQISKSNIANKRYKAVFYDDNKKKVKTTHFGDENGSTYIDHKNKQTKEAWIARHKVRGTFDIATSASALSYYILWTETTFNGGLSNYLKRFNMSKY